MPSLHKILFIIFRNRFRHSKIEFEFQNQEYIISPISWCLKIVNYHNYVQNLTGRQNMETVSYMYEQHSRIYQLIIRIWCNFINSMIYTATQKHVSSSLTLQLCALKLFLKSKKKFNQYLSTKMEALSLYVHVMFTWWHKASAESNYKTTKKLYTQREVTANLALHKWYTHTNACINWNIWNE